METLFGLLAFCEGNPPVTGGFSSQRISNVELCCFLVSPARSCWTNNRVVGVVKRYGPHVTSRQWLLIKPNRYFWSGILDKIKSSQVTVATDYFLIVSQMYWNGLHPNHRSQNIVFTMTISLYLFLKCEELISMFVSEEYFNISSSLISTITAKFLNNKYLQYSQVSFRSETLQRRIFNFAAELGRDRFDADIIGHHKTSSCGCANHMTPLNNDNKLKMIIYHYR